MSQLGVKCPRGNIKHDACRACSMNSLRPCGWTPDMLELIRADNDQEPSHDAFTPSRLLDCDRKSALMSNHDYYQSIDDIWPVVRGHMVHALMERSTYPKAKYVFREKRFETMINTKYGPQKFMGKPDIVVVTREEHTPNQDVPGADDLTWYVKIIDYKSQSEVEHSLISAKRNHQMQLNMYALLVTKALSDHAMKQMHFTLFQPIHIEVTELEIVYVDMKRVRRFTSEGWLRGKGKQLDRRTREKEDLDLEPIHFLTLDDVEEWVRKHIEMKIEAKSELPRPLEGEAARICPYCPMYSICYELASQGV